MSETLQLATELKPCPFCGQMLYKRVHPSIRAEYADGYYVHGFDTTRKHDCILTLHGNFFAFAMTEANREVWNKRVGESEDKNEGESEKSP